MNETFLHFLWKYRLLSRELYTTDHQPVLIINPGLHNPNAGPDFFNARIRINNTLWAGNVEVHVKSSEWYHHAHHTDDNYNNVILHVVFTNNKETLNKKGEKIHVLEVKNKFEENIYEMYTNLMINRNWIPCENLIKSVDPVHINGWITKVMAERLEKKKHTFRTLLEKTGNNWEESCYQFIATHFGTGLNRQPFEMLFRTLPINYFRRYCNDLIKTEALLFGQAGMLEKTFQDDYPNELNGVYSFMRKKLTLEPISGQLWNFLRLRPANFPTIRIAQLAALLYKHKGIFSSIIELNGLYDLIHFFCVEASSYWNNHYIFDKAAQKHVSKSLGTAAIHGIIINVVAPVIFVYAELKDQVSYKDKMIEILEAIPGESNHITRKWNLLGVDSDNAVKSQGMIEMKQSYCDHKKCLECRIGYYLLKPDSCNRMHSIA